MTPIYIFIASLALLISSHTYTQNKVSIVMLGDSITAWGDWPTLLDRGNVHNEGVPSNTTADVLARMDTVYALKPNICFVLIGINDIDKGVPLQETISNYEAIVAGLQAHHITPIIQSTLYGTASYTAGVTELNKELEGYAQLNWISYIDLNKYLSKDGVFKKDLTFDGFHPNEKGYKVWAERLKEFLQNGSGY